MGGDGGGDDVAHYGQGVARNYVGHTPRTRRVPFQFAFRVTTSGFGNHYPHNTLITHSLQHTQLVSNFKAV